MTATRRLAALLAADVAGYSRLVGADEEGTLELGVRYGLEGGLRTTGHRTHRPRLESRCRRWARPARRSGGGKVPSRPASRASIVAIFAGRSIDGAGSPAPPRSEMTTSLGQPRCSALVIIASHRRPCTVSKSPAATTRAGRRWRTGRSVYGNGTLTTSHGSKIGISLAIGFRRPFVEGRERAH